MKTYFKMKNFILFLHNILKLKIHLRQFKIKKIHLLYFDLRFSWAKLRVDIEIFNKNDAPYYLIIVVQYIILAPWEYNFCSVIIVWLHSLTNIWE